MYIISVPIIANTLSEPPAGLQHWLSIPRGQDNEVLMLNGEVEFVRHHDQVMFGSPFDTICVTAIADKRLYILNQEIESKVDEVKRPGF